MDERCLLNAEQTIDARRMMFATINYKFAYKTKNGSYIIIVEFSILLLPEKHISS